MAGSEHIFWTVVLVVVLAFLGYCHGHLQLTMDRSMDNDFCGYLQCWNLDDDNNDISIISGISLYDITRPDVRTLLASVKNDGRGIKINPSSVSTVFGNGSIVGVNASVSVNFRNPLDCQLGSYLCELEYVNIDSQRETIGAESRAPSCDQCDCGALTSQLNTKTAELAALKQQHSDLLLKFQNLSSQVSPTVTPNTPGTTTPPLGSECNRGMAHNSSRVQFLLWARIPALCDTDTDGGGWVVIQRRAKGDIDFYRDWQSYKTGFGTQDTDFWLGNEIIHTLASQGYTELRVDMTYNNVSYYAQYNNFELSDERHNYTLTISGYRGTAGDSLANHDNMLFSTYDRDNDKYSTSCAILLHGAWWYNSCYDSNLNGAWGANDHTGVLWGGLDYTKSVTFTEIKVRHGNV